MALCTGCFDLPQLSLPFTFREKCISRLVYPLCTVLDDSIGCAMWFAARGEGLLYSDKSCSAQLYRSHARVSGDLRYKGLPPDPCGILVNDNMDCFVTKLSCRDLGSFSEESLLSLNLCVYVLFL